MGIDQQGRSATIGNDISLKSPVLTQHLLQQPRIQRAGHIIQRIIGGHDGSGFSFLHTHFESRKVIFTQLFLRYLWIADKAIMLFVVGGKMLGSRNDFQVMRIISLQSVHKGCSHYSTQERVFSIRFRGSSPTRVACHVHGRRPESQHIAELFFLFSSLIQLVPTGTRLIRDHCGYPFLQLRIPGSCQSDGLWKYGETSGTYYSMQCFIAMIVLIDTQTGNAGRSGTKQTDLLFHRQTGNQIHYPFMHRRIFILV